MTIGLKRGHASADSKKCTSNLYCTKEKVHVIRGLRKTLNNWSLLAFADEEVQGIINETKSSKLIAPDGISMLMLKRLNSTGVKFFTMVLKLSLNTLRIPDMWEIGIVVPLLKPANLGYSYHLITLLSPVVKPLEVLLHPTFTFHVSLATILVVTNMVFIKCTAISVKNDCTI